MIIDAHVHYTPPSLAADLDPFTAAEPFWGQMLAPRPGGKSLFRRGRRPRGRRWLGRFPGHGFHASPAACCSARSNSSRVATSQSSPQHGSLPTDTILPSSMLG